MPTRSFVTMGKWKKSTDAMPELAPKRQDHLLGSTSVVQAVTYGKRRLSYRTFDADSVETLRLSYMPRRVVAGTAALQVSPDPAAVGYSPG